MKRARKSDETQPKKRAKLHEYVYKAHPGYHVLKGLHRFLTGKPRTGTEVTTREYAALAKTAYKSDVNEKISIVAEHHGRATLDKELTNEDMTVWLDGDKVIASFRGTSKFKDLSTDAAILIGGEYITDRFQQSVRDYQRVLDKYGDKTHIVTGHSLGGTIAISMHELFQDDISEVHAFNPGSSVTAATKAMHETVHHKDNSNIHQYFIMGDVLSTIGQGNPTTTNHVLSICEGKINPHSLDNFLC